MTSIVDLEAASYVTGDPAKVLASHEQQQKKKKKKKKKYLDECLQQHRSFSPSMIWIAGLLGGSNIEVEELNQKK